MRPISKEVDNLHNRIILSLDSIGNATNDLNLQEITSSCIPLQANAAAPGYRSIHTESQSFLLGTFRSQIYLNVTT